LKAAGRPSADFLILVPKTAKPPPDCFVYVLGHCAKTAGGQLRHITYVGWTHDVAARLAKHNAGKGARSTRGRAWVLLYSEKCASRRHAMSREWHLKRDRAFRKRLTAALGPGL
jgi:putative endonuclease